MGSYSRLLTPCDTCEACRMRKAVVEVNLLNMGMMPRLCHRCVYSLARRYSEALRKVEKGTAPR